MTDADYAAPTVPQIRLYRASPLIQLQGELNDLLVARGDEIEAEEERHRAALARIEVRYRPGVRGLSREMTLAKGEG